MKFLIPYDSALSHPLNTILDMPIDSSYSLGRILHNGNIIGWEREVFAVLLSLIYTRKAGGFLDMGANIGFYAVAVKLIYPNINVAAIEANPKLVKKIAEMASLNGVCIDIINAALTGGKEKRVSFYLAETDDCSSCYALKNSVGEIVVDAVGLDSVPSDYEIWKIDTEGTELNILTPHTELIRVRRPYVTIEILSQARFEKIRALFHTLDYSIYHLAKDYSIQQADQYVPSGGWNYLLAPEAISEDFYAIHQRWRTAIEATGNFQTRKAVRTEAEVYDTLPMEYLRKILDLGKNYSFYPLSSPKWLAFYPASRPKDIHYEFIVNYGKIHFCLHFETPSRENNIKYRDELYNKLFREEIFLSFPIKKNQYSNIYSIEFALVYNPTLPALDLCAEVMKKFVDYTSGALEALPRN